jgi:hypothetical protein
VFTSRLKLRKNKWTEKKRYFILHRARCPAVVWVTVTFLFIRFTRKQLSMRISESLLYRYSSSRPAGGRREVGRKKITGDEFRVMFFFTIIIYFTPPCPKDHSTRISKIRLYNLRVSCAAPCKSYGRYSTDSIILYIWAVARIYCVGFYVCALSMIFCVTRVIDLIIMFH